MDLALLDQTLRERGEPAFRARQVWEWTARGASGYDAMTNLPRALREELAAAVPFSTLSVETERESRDGTVKTLFRTADGHPVEAVLMRYRDGRRSLCLSSQSGCPLTCTFCATGSMAFGRNLTASEILDQALHFRRLDRGRPRGVHGDGRADAQPRRGARRGAAAAGSRDHAPADDDLDGRLAPRAAAVRRRGGGADPARALAPRAGRRAAVADHAGQRALPDRRRRRRVPPPCGRDATPRLRRVRDARRRQRRARAGARPRGTARPRPLQGQPHPVQPDGACSRARRGSGSPPSGTSSSAAHVPVTVRLTRGRDIEAACGQLAAAPRVRLRSAPPSAPAPARPLARDAPRSRT